MYILDTNIFITLKAYYKSRFPTVWDRLGTLATGGKLFSVREVYSEIKDDTGDVADWVHSHRNIFRDPTNEEFLFVHEIFRHKHFQGLIKSRDINQGRRVADPFVIAAAKIYNSTVVTQEQFVPNGAKIPNICSKFGIPCINMEKFLEKEKLP